MSTRISTFALAAAFSVAALGSTGASAKPVMGLIITPKPVLGVVVKPPVLGVPVKPPVVTGVIIKPPHPILGVVINHDHDHDHDWDGPHFSWWWHHHRSPVVIEEGVPGSVSTPVASGPSSPGPCTCLTKQ